MRQAGVATSNQQKTLFAHLAAVDAGARIALCRLDPSDAN